MATVRSPLSQPGSCSPHERTLTLLGKAVVPGTAPFPHHVCTAQGGGGGFPSDEQFLNVPHRGALGTGKRGGLCFTQLQPPAPVSSAGPRAQGVLGWKRRGCSTATALYFHGHFSERSQQCSLPCHAVLASPVRSRELDTMIPFPLETSLGSPCPGAAGGSPGPAPLRRPEPRGVSRSSRPELLQAGPGAPERPRGTARRSCDGGARISASCWGPTTGHGGACQPSGRWEWEQEPEGKVSPIKMGTVGLMLGFVSRYLKPF